jgi:hypothetical protein
MADVTLALIEDEVFVREAWQLSVKKTSMMSFETPEAFLAKCRTEPRFLAGLKVVVTDFHFGSASERDGAWLKDEVNRLRHDLPVVLSSDSGTVGQASDGFRLVIDKRPYEWGEIEGLLSSS